MALWASFAAVAYAADAQSSGVPGLEFLQLDANADIGAVLTKLYIWGIAFVALAAFFMLTAGGVRYMFAGDRDPSEAKTWIKNSIYGLLLALGSYLILYTINPDLVNVTKLNLPEITAPPSQQPTGTVEENGTCQAALGASPSESCKSPLVCAGALRQSFTTECYENLTQTAGTCQRPNKMCNYEPPPPTRGEYRCKRSGTDQCDTSGTYTDSMCDNRCPGRCVPKGGCQG